MVVGASMASAQIDADIWLGVVLNWNDSRFTARIELKVVDL
jgi:hypothetical protein